MYGTQNDNNYDLKHLVNTIPKDCVVSIIYTHYLKCQQYIPIQINVNLCLYSLLKDSIVEQLQQRYDMNQIYTYIGDILVAVNPFTNLGMYTSSVS